MLNRRDAWEGGTLEELVLASTSAIRVSILESAGFHIRAESPSFDESTVVEGTPAEVALARAEGKVRSVVEQNSGNFIVGSDTVVADENGQYGKPESREHHYRRLLAFRGRVHTLYTGFAIFSPNGSLVSGVEETTLTVRADLDESELLAYVQAKEGLFCAGGYAVEGHGSMLFTSVDGDWNTVLGLPLFRIISVLRVAGWRYGPGGYSVVS